MLILVNTNGMRPPIAPIGLEYVAAAVRQAGTGVSVIDLGLADDQEAALRSGFAGSQPRLVGLSFRNADDSFWPSTAWFVPQLTRTVGLIRGLTDAPVVLGGCGFSIFAERLVEHTGADFGIRGDGELAIISLLGELIGQRRFDRVGGLLWRHNGRIISNAPAWADIFAAPATRDIVDDPTSPTSGLD